MLFCYLFDLGPVRSHSLRRQTTRYRLFFQCSCVEPSSLISIITVFSSSVCCIIWIEIKKNFLLFSRWNFDWPNFFLSYLKSLEVASKCLVFLIYYASWSWNLRFTFRLELLTLFSAEDLFLASTAPRGSFFFEPISMKIFFRLRWKVETVKRFKATWDDEQQKIPRERIRQKVCLR
jgi:hypothetical protein